MARLTTALDPFKGGFEQWGYVPPVLQQSGQTVSWLRANVDTWISAATDAPEWALVNIGVNDIVAGLSQATYEADLAYVLDAINAAWPSCKPRVAYPWMVGYDAQCNSMAGWIDNVLTPRAAWAGAGHDERVWAKGADNGATMLRDGVHYSDAGQTECAAQWQTVMGY